MRKSLLTDRSIKFFVTFLAINAFASAAPYGQPTDSIKVLRISGQDQRALIKKSDGETMVIKPGDSLGDGVKILEIVSGRIVIEEKKGKETERVIIRFEAGKQTVERISKSLVQPPAMLAPSVSNPDTGGTKSKNRIH